MAIETATGKSATIEFNGALCIHARRCVLTEPGAFKANVQGSWLDAESVTLCRCGHSANKPYCDGTHRKIGFVAP